MHDLTLLSDADDFSVSAGPPRIALVHHGFRTTQLGLQDERTAKFAARYASLGLLHLARSLEVDFAAGQLTYAPEVRYFDEDCFVDDDAMVQAMVAWLAPAKARFVLVGMYSLAAVRTGALLARLDPRRVCIVVGGAHPTVAPEMDGAHLVVRGEGGTALRHVLNHLGSEQFGQGPDARGICYRWRGEQCISKAAFDNALATMPAPAFRYELSQSRVDPTQRPRVRWWKSVGLSPQIYVCTQSCRARCTFCSTYFIHGRQVSRPAHLVAGDLDHIVDGLGHDSIQFHDDDLLQHAEFDALLEVLTERRVQWTCNARSEVLTAEVANRLYAAGCRKVFLGLESLDQESLDYYNKATTVEMNERAVRALDTAGIGVVAGYIIGAPHDTLARCLADLDRLLALPVFFLSASILTPDIGTVEFIRAQKTIPDLDKLGDNGSTVNIRPRPEIFGTASPFGLPTVCRALSKLELNEVYHWANCAFFLRPDTYERIVQHTPQDRVEELQAWYALHYERVAMLATSAKLGPIRARAAALLEQCRPVMSLVTAPRVPSNPLPSQQLAL